MTKAEIQKKITEIRHHIHMHPELALEEHETSDYIASILEELGLEVTRGIGGTGVVATLTAGTGGKMIGLRAVWTPCPLPSRTTSPINPSILERCTAAARQPCCLSHRGGHAAQGGPQLQRDGGIHLPAGEEPGVGTKAMIEDGFFEKFPISEIYGQHNNPLEPLGKITVCPSVAASSEDDFWITIHGLGGHASAPQNTRDPLVTAAEIVMQLQTIVSRNLNPLSAGTVSCCDIQTDGVMNAIPSTVTILGDCRSYDPAVQETIEKRMREIVKHVCEMNGCGWELRYDHVFIPMVNDPTCVQAVVDAAASLYGAERVDSAVPPLSGSEDFAWFQRRVPGAYFRVGTRPEGSTQVYPQHNACYNFNDDAILIASEVFATIIRNRLK